MHGLKYSGLRLWIFRISKTRPARRMAFSYSVFNGPLASASSTVRIQAIWISNLSVAAYVDWRRLVVVPLTEYEFAEGGKIFQADAIIRIGLPSPVGNISQEILAPELFGNFGIRAFDSIIVGWEEGAAAGVLGQIRQFGF